MNIYHFSQFQCISVTTNKVLAFKTITNVVTKKIIIVLTIASISRRCEFHSTAVEEFTREYEAIDFSNETHMMNAWNIEIKSYKFILKNYQTNVFLKEPEDTVSIYLLVVVLKIITFPIITRGQASAPTAN